MAGLSLEAPPGTRTGGPREGAAGISRAERAAPAYFWHIALAAAISGFPGAILAA